jgi:hypothetical protein
MLNLKNTYRTTILLFLLIWIPSQIYGEDYFSQSFRDLNFGAENEMTNQRVTCKNLTNDPLKKIHNKDKELSYYLYIEDFINSFIEIPTSNVLDDSSTISSQYLAGRAPVYNLNNEEVGICSASFLCIQNEENIFTAISNYLTIDNGLIISWFTPTTLINLELDSIIHSMVTECLVIASTKIGFNPFYGKKFNMIVSSDSQKIYFKLNKI